MIRPKHPLRNFLNRHNHERADDAANGPRLGGWLSNTADNDFGHGI
jgi:hypothetical protein